MRDENYYDAIKLAMATGSVSVPLLQQQLGIDRARATAIIAMMEQEGIVGEDQDVLAVKPEYRKARNCP